MKNCINVDDWMSVLKNAPYHLSTCVDKDTPEIRWIANLSNGITIYDSVNNESLDTPSAWLRLKRFCDDTKISITQLRLQYHEHLITLAAHAEGYFYAKRMIVTANVINSFQQKAVGVGHMDIDKNLHIRWFTDLGLVEYEIRKVHKTSKYKFQSLIVKNDI